MKPMCAMVVLPTYNEAENIIPITENILAQRSDLKILIVDDNSPDGTGSIADRLALKYPERIHVAHRAKKEGLGMAYLFGFRRALELGAKQIVHMDADFSHPPALIPQMLEQLKHYDFVLGSRYIPGGGTKNWNLFRRFLSKVGNLYAGFILRSPIRDLTGGFKAFNRPVVEYLLTNPLDSAGYCFQIEATVRASHAGFRYIELPFIFPEREKGSSKMSKKIVLEALLKTFSLRKKLKFLKPVHPDKPLPAKSASYLIESVP